MDQARTETIGNECRVPLFGNPLKRRTKKKHFPDVSCPLSLYFFPPLLQPTRPALRIVEGGHTQGQSSCFCFTSTKTAPSIPNAPFPPKPPPQPKKNPRDHERLLRTPNLRTTLSHGRTAFLNTRIPSLVTQPPLPRVPGALPSSTNPRERKPMTCAGHGPVGWSTLPPRGRVVAWPLRSGAQTTFGCGIPPGILRVGLESGRVRTAEVL